MSDLKFMLDSQKEFQKLLGNDIESLKFKREMIEALHVELAEALNELPWKHWKKYKTIDLENFRNELIDIQIFLINLFLSANMDADMVFKLFREKVIKNIERQRDGY